MKYIFIIAISFSLGCSSSTSVIENPPSAEELLYKHSYEAIATRIDSGYSWVGVLGTMKMQLFMSDDQSGHIYFKYVNYKEPQFVYNACSGQYSGNYRKIEGNSLTYPDYNILGPYGSPNTENYEYPYSEDRIATYFFDLSINHKSLSLDCREKLDRTIIIHQHKNEEIVLISEYRQIKMKKSSEENDCSPQSKTKYQGCCSGRGGIKIENGCIVFDQNKLVCSDNTASPTCVKK